MKWKKAATFVLYCFSKLESMCAPKKKSTPGHIVSYPTSEVLK